MRKLYFCSLSAKFLFTAVLTVGAALGADAAQLPFTCGFDSEADFGQFSFKDADGDGSTWSYDSMNGAVTSGGAWGIPNDWLISPQFTMTGGREYSVSFTAWSGWDYYEQHFSVKLGKGDNPDGYSKVIADDIMVKLTEKQNFSFNFTPDADGDYSIAFNIFKSAPFYGALIDNISVVALTDPAAPAAVTDFEVAAGEKGALSASVSFRAPVETVGKAALSKIDRITLKRGDTLLKEYTEVTPGSLLTYDDSEATAGNCTYTVIAYLGELEGQPSTKQAWIGPDVPAAPVDFFVTDNLDGSVTMDWQLPATGSHGGYIDPAKVSFNLYQYKQGEYMLLTKINAGLTQSKFSIGNTDIDVQQMVLFGLMAESEQGQSGVALSNEYLIGEPYVTPFYESFPGGNPVNGIWITHAGECDWSGTDVAAFDGDKGAIVFTVPMALEGGTYTNAIESGKIDISGEDTPGLVFRYLAYPGMDLTLNTLIRKNGGKEYKNIHTIDYRTIGGNDNEWRAVYVPLSDFKDSEYITISFEGTATDPSTAIVVDGVEVRNVTTRDLAVKYSALPKKTIAGQNVSLYVSVENLGCEDSGKFKINLYGNDNIVKTAEIENLPAFTTKVYELTFPTSVADTDYDLYAEVVLADDANSSNDRTPSSSLTLDRPDYDKVSDLKAEKGADSSVSLSWSPVVPVSSPVTDDAEKYDPFTITDFGSWATADIDGLPSVGLGGSYPHKDEVFPFIIFNPVELGMPVDEPSAAAFKAHSGNQYFAAVTGQGYNDDWLISEKLSGEAQTISLFARSYNVTYGMEKFEILFSDSSRETTAFKAPEGTYSFEVPAEWTEYKVDIPEGAQYFAIHYISGYVWMLMLDDITYTPAVPVVTGYNIYRDRELIATTDAADGTAYSDKDVPEGDHTYNVSVCYDENRESDLSNDASVSMSGIGMTVADSTNRTEVYDLSGHLLYDGASPLDELNLLPGIYIIRSKGKVSKKIVR